MKLLTPLLYLLACSTSAFCVTVDEFKKLEKSAQQGDAESQYNLGVCYENGEGVEKDPKQAFKWYEKAAKQGDAKGQYFLGLCYEGGEGVEQDFKKSAEWIKKSKESRKGTK